jgi:hypothetical protein
MTRGLAGIAASLLVAVLAVACGGGASPAASTTPSTLAPTPTPTPSPTPTGCTPGGDCSSNQSPVARVILRIYRAWDNKNQVVDPTPDPYHEVLRNPVPVYYCFLFDITGRDEHNYETQGPGGDGHGIVWLPSDEHTLEFGGEKSVWQRKYCAAHPGTMSMCAEWDGVYSNCVRIKVVPCDAAAPPPYTCK